MSYVFLVGEDMVWSPTRRVGELYVGMLAVAADVLKQPTGLGPDLGEMYEIDMIAFEAFLKELLAFRAESYHQYLWMLVDGVLPISIAMFERGGGVITGETDRQNEYLAEVHRMDLPMQK